MLHSVFFPLFFMATTSMSVNGDGGNISREDIQAAIDKAVELRALHAALMQGNMNRNSPAHLRFLSASPPLPRPPSQFSAHDYPVFTPSYEDEPLSYGPMQMASKALSESWYENRIGENQDAIDGERTNASSRKGLPPRLVNLEPHMCPADDNASVTSSSTNHLAFLQNSPGTEILRSRRRNSLGDFKSVSSCNKSKPAKVSADSDNRSSKHSNIVVPLTDSHASMGVSHTKSRGTVFSWLFPKFRRRQKHENTSPIRTESEEVSQVLQDLGIVSIETLKKELIDANIKRDAALREVSEMRSSFEELKKKLENLESYCEELRKALRQASWGNEKLGSLSRRGQPVDGKKGGDSLMPVDEDVMIEGFLQIVSEARLSVKQFCKMLTAQIQETDEPLMENLNQLLKPYKVTVNSKYSKAVFYHLEAIINQAFYLDFENCVFQKNGSPKFLDPQHDRQAQFQSFVALRNLSWNEVLRKGTKYYSEEFSKFCDQKMSCIIVTLNWTRPWPEPLLQSFFVAAKCIWLLHLLAFSFFPPLAILRVEENRPFDPHYMEDMFIEKQKLQGVNRVKIMVMPGFYVQDRILRCKVLCRHKYAV